MVPLFLIGAPVLYVIDDVMSIIIGLGLLNMTRYERWKRLTRVQSRRDDVEHVSIHVRMYGPIARCVIAGSNEDRISLSHSDTYHVYRRCLNVGLQRKKSGQIKEGLTRIFDLHRQLQ